MTKSDIFWTDFEQASERLYHTVVMYDGSPVFVQSLVNGLGHEDGDHRANLVTCDPKREEMRKKLNSPKFKRFRELPTLGWFNASFKNFEAVLLTRRAVTTRLHGLSANNVLCHSFRNSITSDVNPVLVSTGDYNFNHFMYDEGFGQMQKGVYPSMVATLNNIVQKSAIAISPRYCITRDGRGIRWLYRLNECVGLFTGNDTLNLVASFAFLREEIMDDKAFTITTIREF